MVKINLTGTGVALVTPFHTDKTIDFDALANLMEYQIKSGIDYFVVLGTTAETPTLSAEEKATLRRFISDQVAGRVPLVLGLGGNNTMELANELQTIDLTDFSAILSVVPYYNKPSQEGIFQHYSMLAQASPLPLILYNVPGRTGVNMNPETVLRLAHRFPGHIIGIKEASGNIQQAEDIIKQKPHDFMVISGDDAMTYPMIAMGAVGVISVIGNAFPAEFSKMVRLALQGHRDEALDIHHRFTDMFRLLFVDGNPAGVKCVLHAMGMIENELRLPLVPTRLTTLQEINDVLARLGVSL